jgi:hypothetical protein
LRPFELFFEIEEALNSIGFSWALIGHVTGYFREFQGANRPMVNLDAVAKNLRMSLKHRFTISG